MTLVADTRRGRRRPILSILQRHGQLQEQLTSSQLRVTQSSHKSQIHSGISEVSEDYSGEAEYDNRVLQDRLRKGPARETRQSKFRML